MKLIEFLIKNQLIKLFMGENLKKYFRFKQILKKV